MKIKNIIGLLKPHKLKDKTKTIADNYFLIEIVNNKLSIKSTNLNEFVETWEILDCEVNNQSYLVEKDFLLQFSKVKSEINLSFDKDKIIVEYDNLSFNSTLSNSEQFVSFPKLKDVKPINIYENFFDELTKFVSNDNLRPVAMCVNIQSKDNILKCVATDYIRMAKYTYNCENNNQFNINISTSFCKLLKNIDIYNVVLGDLDKEYTPSIDKHYIRIVDKNTIIHSKLICGNFPNYEGVIPTHDKFVTITNKKEFIEVLKKAIKLNRHNRIRLTYNNLMFTKFDCGEVIELFSCKVDYFDAPEFEMIFYCKNLLSIVETLKSNEIIISYDTPHRAILINDYYSHYDRLFLLMPLTI